MSRDYAVHVEARGLVTVTGGKWTAYRSMAEACVDRAAMAPAVAAVLGRDRAWEAEQVRAFDRLAAGNRL
ncbi:MAG: hypothetical protein ACRC33_23860 [Gemmataceae bacterium]